MKDCTLVKDLTVVEYVMRILELIMITVYMEEMCMDLQVQTISKSYKMKQMSKY